MLKLGVIGYPIEHSLSPNLHEALGKALSVPLTYQRLAVRPEADLGATLTRLLRMGLRGVNVTIPHKVSCLGFAEVLTPDARAAGAVNTLLFEEAGHVIGHNTDVQGFLDALREADVAYERGQALVLGAGGAARAVALGLLRAGTNVAVAARRPEQAQALIAALAERLPADSGQVSSVAWKDRAAAVPETTLVVNATPVGLWPAVEHDPLSEAHFTDQQAVVDLVYRPLHTRMLARAEAAGARIVDGLGMLVHQGARSLAFWRGTPMGTDALVLTTVRQALMDELTQAGGES
ncbi:MAG: shikimate dehydrogenase [Planctomycetota bacterium]|jgi:shikimate dehydrogenase